MIIIPNIGTKFTCEGSDIIETVIHVDEEWIESESVINGAISFGDFCRTSEWRELVKSGKITILDTNYFKSKGL